MRLLLSGLDTVECAYYLRPGADCKLDFADLRERRELIRQSKHPDPAVIELGGTEFLLSPNGTASGYLRQFIGEIRFDGQRVVMRGRKAALLAAAAEKEMVTARVPTSSYGWLVDLGSN
jgi:hypothetical protein